MGAKTYVTPQPALMIATYDAEGTPNVMMAAWGGQCDGNKVCFCLSTHKTTDNLRLNQAFTLSYADARTIAESDYFGIESGNKTNKVAAAGFTATPSQNVKAPIIDQYPLAMECRVVEMRNDADGGAFVVGEIVGAVADPAILTPEGKIDIRKLNPVAWDAASLNYFTLGDSVGQAWHSGRAVMEK
ncbi:MAG: flavin reductase [Bacteroidales bacterium]|nr:flavin reductase [Bacteroidales bacterium]